MYLLVLSGIYEPIDKANYVYGHCMRAIGFGEENGIRYWTAVNSWGRNWGDNGNKTLSKTYVTGKNAFHGYQWC